MTRTRSILDDMKVTVPEGMKGEWRVERFTIKDSGGVEGIRLAMTGRGIDPGTYTRLMNGRTLVMSDTPAERRDHYEAARRIIRAEQVLIGGLGLGMILNLALEQDNITRVDVVEISQEVIDLVGPHYQKMAEDSGIILRIHQDDVFTWKPERGSRWDVAWFDVWHQVSTDDIPAMNQLKTRYRHRTKWCGCWGRDLIRR